MKREFLSYTENYSRSPLSFTDRLSAWLSGFRTMPAPVTALAALALVVLTGGGMSYAAEQALPGDLLYPVKVSVNEEVRRVFHHSEDARVAYDIRRANSRLSEVEQLALRGEISQAAWSDISENLDAHIEDLKTYITEQQTQEKLTTPKATTTISTSSDRSADSDDLESASTSTGPASSTVASLDPSSTSSASSSEIATSASIQTEDNEDNSPETIVEQHRSRSEAELETVNDQIEQATSTLPSDDREVLQDKLEEAKELFERSLNQMERKEYDQALKGFNNAQQVMREIKQAIKENTKQSATSLTPTATTSLEQGVTATSSTSSSSASSTSATSSATSSPASSE